MTEDFKKGLATGLAVGGVTVIKGGGDGECFKKVKFIECKLVEDEVTYKLKGKLEIDFLKKTYTKIM